MGESAPALYTVEEAAKLLRIGRTKAYALTQEWRATGGKTGLPVVDFGHVLRVPRAALEKMVGVELTGAVEASAPMAGPGRVNEAEAEPAATETETKADPPAATAADAPSRKRPRPPSSDGNDQLDLFNVAS